VIGITGRRRDEITAYPVRLWQLRSVLEENQRDGGGDMRKQLAAGLAIVALLGGCKKADHDTGAVDNDRAGVDTMVKSGTVKDTTVVKADTNIDVDTVKHTDHIKKDSQ
jgi:hypothetical protein